jgi:hypothetical protein
MREHFLEMQELEALKMELRNLRTREDSRSASHHASRTAHSYPDVQLKRDHLERLIMEKKNLLSTGMYTEDDKIIKKLNTEIEQLQEHLALFQ